ncbi:MAG: hypothetical protein ACXIVO_13725 [Glycocaulis sp.]
MAKKNYVVANGITITPGNGKDKLTGGDEITLSEAEAAPLLTAGYLKEAPPPRKAKNAGSGQSGPAGGDALPVTLKPVEGRDYVVTIPGTDETVTTGQLLAEAYAESGLNVKAWNAQSDEEIADHLDAALKALAAKAAPKAD